MTDAEILPLTIPTAVLTTNGYAFGDVHHKAQTNKCEGPHRHKIYSVDVRFGGSETQAYIPRTNMFTVLQLRVYYKNNVSLLNGGTVSRTFVYGFLELRGERVGV